MESLGYLILYLLHGRLPWQGVQAASSMEKIEAILSIKVNTPLSELCRGLPDEFLTYMTFVRDMAQYDIPNYDAIKTLFRELAEKEVIEYDYQYDWSHSSLKELDDTAGGDASGDYHLRAPRTVSNCSSSPPSDCTISH